MANDSKIDLERFVKAQRRDYEVALGELRAGLKQSHWIWYIFPQIEGLGHSYMCQIYNIRSLAEAKAYLAHPLLGERLRECARAVLAHPGKQVAEIMGSIDAVKLRSSMTLFWIASDRSDEVFRQVLDTFFGGQCDGRTLDALSKEAGVG